MTRTTRLSSVPNRASGRLVAIICAALLAPGETAFLPQATPPATAQAAAVEPKLPPEQLDALVARWKGEASQGALSIRTTPEQAEANYRAAGAALRALVWDPIAPKLADAARKCIDHQIHPTVLVEHRCGRFTEDRFHGRFCHGRTIASMPFTRR